MTINHHSLPPAPPEMEAHVKEVFPIHIEPEQFVAEDGGGWMDFAFNDYRFKDPELDSWIHAVGKIIRDPDLFEEVLRKYSNITE